MDKVALVTGSSRGIGAATARLLAEAGIIVHDMDVNSLVTTMEMAGASISIMKMDEELLHYYDMPCRSPYYNK